MPYDSFDTSPSRLTDQATQTLSSRSRSPSPSLAPQGGLGGETSPPPFTLQPLDLTAAGPNRSTTSKRSLDDVSADLQNHEAGPPRKSRWGFRPHVPGGEPVAKAPAKDAVQITHSTRALRLPYSFPVLKSAQPLNGLDTAKPEEHSALMQEHLIWVMRQALNARVACATRIAEWLRAQGSPLMYYSTPHLRRIYSDFKKHPAAFGTGVEPPCVPPGFDFASLNAVKAPWHDTRVLNDVLAKNPSVQADEFVELALPLVQATTASDVRAWFHSELRPGHYPPGAAPSLAGAGATADPAMATVKKEEEADESTQAAQRRTEKEAALASTAEDIEAARILMSIAMSSKRAS